MQFWGNPLYKVVLGVSTVKAVNYTIYYWGSPMGTGCWVLHHSFLGVSTVQTCVMNHAVLGVSTFQSWVLHYAVLGVSTVQN